MPENLNEISPALVPAELTVAEIEAMDLLTTFWRKMEHEVIGHEDTRHQDMSELVIHIHALQQAIMSQVASRIYPMQYRALGEVGAWEDKPEPAQIAHEDLFGEIK